MSLSTDPKERKNAPVARGLLDYFPDACIAVAELSRIGNEQHNPGQPMHWAREKSTDHADCIARHLIERGTVDTDGVRHSTKVAWRALALLQLEIEEAENKYTAVSVDTPDWMKVPAKPVSEMVRKFGKEDIPVAEYGTALCQDCGHTYGEHFEWSCGGLEEVPTSWLMRDPYGIEWKTIGRWLRKDITGRYRSRPIRRI